MAFGLLNLRVNKYKFNWTIKMFIIIIIITLKLAYNVEKIKRFSHKATLSWILLFFWTWRHAACHVLPPIISQGRAGIPATSQPAKNG
jgi:hypothetical protein